MIEKQTKKVLISEIMNTDVISVSPSTPVLEAAKIITEHNFDGIPVVDKSNHLLGILTEYDLITKTSPINITFIRKVLSDIHSKKDGEQENISDLTVGEIMNKEPLTLKGDTTYEQVLETFKEHHRVNPIPIVDNENKVIGVISRFDVLRPLNILSHSTKK